MSFVPSSPTGRFPSGNFPPFHRIPAAKTDSERLAVQRLRNALIPEREREAVAKIMANADYSSMEIRLAELYQGSPYGR